MSTRRAASVTMLSLAAFLGACVLPALAEDLVGRITKVNASSNTITVVAKGSDKSTDLKVTPETEWVLPNSDRKPDLKRLEQMVEKAKKGVNAEISHDAGVAKKIKLQARKKKDAS